MQLTSKANCLPLAAAVLFCLASGAGAGPITNAVPYAARPLPLSAVRLTDGPLKRAQDLTAQHLLALEPDRMMAGYRLRAGLEPEAESYGGWDSVTGRQLTGHIAGHFLSAASLMYAATGDRRFKDRVNYLIEEMKEVQDKRGTGYLGAVSNSEGTDGALIFEQEIAKGNIRSGGFDLNGMWSPWYTLHKTFAGLRDAYRHTGNRTALELKIRFAGWTERVLSGLDEAQVQRMLNTEFGAMNEALADLYADTGDRRWLELSHRFDHRAVLDPLIRGEDRLAGLHANTQVPKLYGHLVRHVYTGNKDDGAAARFFWERVVRHHSYATGGHSKDEYFGQPDQLNDRIDGRTAETCNIYNMLKMTRRLFALRPEIQYADFHERALFNHILGSICPVDGSTCYMVPVGRGVRREYSDMFRSFTCCVGTGMESHALHGYGIYYESGDRLWVNFYAPSTAEWKAAGLKLEMGTTFPGGDSAALRLTLESPKAFTLALRRPWWAGEGFAVRVNGGPVSDLPGPGSYVELRRTWNSGDTVELTLPKRLHLDPTPDNPRRAAIMWGPLVLAGDLGPEDQRVQGRGALAIQVGDVPVFVAADRPVAEWIRPVPGKPGAFRSDGVGRPRDVDFLPFYRLHRRTYAAYWDLFTPSEWEKRSVEIAAQWDKHRRLEAATVAFAQPGEMQPERDFNMQGEQTTPYRVMGRAGRRGSQWFSFDLPVDPAHPMALVVTYYSSEWRRRTFDILVDGRRVGQQEVRRNGQPRFFDVEYAIPADLVAGKQKVTVRFEATGGNEIAAVYGIRMIRADMER